MKKFGLIGFPLGHSFSKGYFTEKFESENLSGYSYENYAIDNIAKLKDLIKAEPLLRGLNVTIPYKEQVIQYLDEMDDEAGMIGAVNTIKIIRSGRSYKLKGYNTDVIGFEQPLLKVLKPIHNSALVLGTGGASKAVLFILNKHGIRHINVSRNPKNSSMISYSDLTRELVLKNKLIINTSPLGMFPDIDNCPPIPYDAIGPDHILYDLIYNPEKTLFLQKGEEKKATLINGLPMLYGQAECSWQIWNA
jgi:shikimate dehydrogenase